MAAGCSGKTSAGAEATGVVTLDGSPLADVLVNFYPQGGGSSAFATTDAEGKFTVKTSGAETGLAPGEYTVSVSPPDADSEAAEGAAGPPAIPEKYASGKTSGLKVTVSGGQANELKIELSSEK